MLLAGKAWNGHISASLCVPLITKKNINCFIDTYHLCSTDLDWNPIYCMVGRKECLEYLSKGIKFDFENDTKVQCNEHIYDELLNTDTLEENLKNIKLLIKAPF